MNFIKTLNERLTKTICIVCLCLFCQLGQAQFILTPIGDYEPSDVVLGDANNVGYLDLADLNVSINHINYAEPIADSDLFDEYGPNAIAYEVYLNFDFDWGPITASQTAEIIEFNFSILLEGFNNWYFGPWDVLYCNGGVDDVIYVEDENNPNLWHISVDFGEDGATYEALSCITDHLALIAIVIEGADRDYLTASYDCYDYHNEVFANVEISNAKFTMRDGRQSILAEYSGVSGDDFEENYHLPSCFRDSLTLLGTYDINLMISDINDEGVEVGVYLRSNTDTAPPVSGEVHVAFKHTEFQSAALSPDSPISGTLTEITFAQDYSHTVFSFDNVTGLGIDNQQIHLATLVYPYNAVDIDCMFMAHDNATKIWDADGVELTLVGEQERETIIGSPPSNKLIAPDHTLINISPNPANATIQVDLPAISNHALLSIVDVQGKNVLDKNIAPQSIDVLTLDVLHLEKGLYLIKLTDQEQIYLNKLIID